MCRVNEERLLLKGSLNFLASDSAVVSVSPCLHNRIHLVLEAYRLAIAAFLSSGRSCFAFKCHASGLTTNSRTVVGLRNKGEQEFDPVSTAQRAYLLMIIGEQSCVWLMTVKHHHARKTISALHPSLTPAYLLGSTENMLQGRSSDSNQSPRGYWLRMWL